MKKDLIKLIAKEIANSSETVLSEREKEFLISFKIEGEAVVKKGEDYSQISYFSIPWDKMCLILLSKLNGVTVQSVLNEVLSNDNLDTTVIKGQAKSAMKEIKGNSVRNFGGKVTVKAENLISSEIDECEYC